MYRTPLHAACKWNRLDMALLLARNGADLNAMDSVIFISFYLF